MSNVTDSRNFILDKLKRELIGPDPIGEEIDCEQPIVFNNKKQSYKSYVQKGTREELLQRDSPLTRYGAGTLYALPFVEKESKVKITDPLKKVTFDEEGTIISRETKSGEVYLGYLPEENERIGQDAAVAGFDLSSANKPLPNSMAVSFLTELDKKSQLIVNVSGGRYFPFPVKIEQQNRTFWRQKSVKITAKFNCLENIRTGQTIKPSTIKSSNAENLNLAVELFARPTKVANRYLITVALVNRTKTVQGKMPDQFALFQSEFFVRAVSPTSNRLILPYPVESESCEMTDEEQSIDMLYRQARPYAVGHGCAADWDKEVSPDERVKEVVANAFPTYEIPRTSSEIKGDDGLPLEIPMARLAGLIDGEDGISDLEEMVDQYDKWINRRQVEVKTLPARYQQAGYRHLRDCRIVSNRMRDGIRFLKSDPLAYQAFQLANQAILMQQHRSKAPLRKTSVDQKSKQPTFETNNTDPELLDPNSKLGKWRAFQIGFQLLSLRSAVDPDCAERDTVDLLWFPTGGGKTEAYLALAAFSIFHRRLKNPKDLGVVVFMRYTLRLLSAQQFQRTGALVCAMEALRRKDPEALGSDEISIGLWLGNEITPGTRSAAAADYNRLITHPQTTDNKFILNRCPWCGAEIGKIDTREQGNKSGQRNIDIVGYKKMHGQIVLHCPDQSCKFHERLPIYVVDEDLYENPPTILLATADKFAVFALKPQARALFGIGKNGERIYSPPAIKLVDEEHLLTGPLGTIVGLNECLVDELGTDRRGGRDVRPKIIASTATIRAYREQNKALFACEQTQLFPPPGLDAGNSFFARYARDENGKLLPGRLYVGVNAPGLGSLQNTEVRTYTALLQSAAELSPGERNHYWTLLCFFNNLKALGNTVSLFQANVMSYFLAHQTRCQQPQSRRIRQLLELTGQLRGDEVMTALKKIEIDYSEAANRAVDVCLCSSILEVGVDVSRLSLMSIVSQPKSAAQYIQISSRVGRDDNHPGLVVVIFSPFNARDRSHFEHFRAFHQRLYAHVEPSTVTPFSPPALERALHAVMCAFIRQMGTSRQAATSYPCPEVELERFKQILLARLQIIAPEMRDEFERIYERRIKEWQRWGHRNWIAEPHSGEQSGLMRVADTWADEQTKFSSWAIPLSMRSVDTESELRVTNYYRFLENE